MQKHILWADDEIDLLKPHVMYLESKGYKLSTVNNGAEAIDMVKENFYDIVFLDENMPGVSGLEALQEIKNVDPTLPVIMITKSEEETIMEEAIGSKISDYLIKPVNPSQILLSIKKNLDEKRLIEEKTSSAYQQQFRQIGMDLMNHMDPTEWAEMYKKLVHWNLELSSSADKAMEEIFVMQKNEANGQFIKFIKNNYTDWVSGNDPEAPEMSHNLFQKRVKPVLEANPDDTVFLMVIDNLRYDQWKTLQPLITEFFRVEEEDIFYSILPTATHYSRNALFAGLMPDQIQKKFPNFWKSENDEGGKNMHEKDFLADNLRRLGLDLKWSYNKITNLNAGRKLADNFNQLLHNRLNVIVYNFVDMLSHARTEMEVIKELADDEPAYRSLTLSWFEHSPLYDIMRQIAEHKGRMIIATDHGTIRVNNPVKVQGDRNTNTNLRYKVGKNLNYNSKEVFEVRNPSDAGLPKANMSSSFIFAEDEDFFVYPNNFNHFVKYYTNTFQHGGISMEEMLIPIVVLQPK